MDEEHSVLRRAARSGVRRSKFGSAQESGKVANWRGFERFGPGGWLLRLASLAASPNLLAMSEGKWCGSVGERGVYPQGA